MEFGMMDESKFPKILDYDDIKQKFGQDEDTCMHIASLDSSEVDAVSQHEVLDFSANLANNNVENKAGLTGTRLRSYAFAVLTRREYSKADLIQKLALYAADQAEVIELVDELSRENYQSDQRLAEMTVRSQVRKGKGPNRIKLALNAKKIDKALIADDLKEIDWYEQAYALKVKKYGADITKDPKIKAKQIRFLQYRGFEMDAIMKAISRSEESN